MPKVKQSPMEELRNRVLARWDYAATVAKVSREQFIKVMGISRGTYYRRRSDIESMTLGEIWAAERATGCELSVPFQRKGEKSDA